MSTIAEVLDLVERGKLVHPTVAALGDMMSHRSGITFVPIDDLPPLPLGLIWVTAHKNARIHALAATAADI